MSQLTCVFTSLGLCLGSAVIGIPNMKTSLAWIGIVALVCLCITHFVATSFPDANDEIASGQTREKIETLLKSEVFHGVHYESIRCRGAKNHAEVVLRGVYIEDAERIVKIVSEDVNKFSSRDIKLVFYLATPNTAPSRKEFWIKKATKDF